ncbi:MAG: septum formation inhibitor Maf [Acidobacteria bacterium]|nr:septum formation inhibitor Maf [Acidobacteriota bacterium]
MGKIPLLFSLLTAFSSGQTTNTRSVPGDKDYWYQGLAEISRFELQQSRYGDIHTGEAVLVFVTEDFLSDLQVKHEHGPKTHAVPILKLNMMRRFNTGIYPYSTMTSIFTPVGTPEQTLKISTSVQEWCGHTYLQFNHRDAGWQVLSHSYFQDEADQQLMLPQAMAEDGIWTLIRLNPKMLPTGNFDLIPGSVHTRFKHLDLAVVQANGALRTTDELTTYTLTYADGSRTLSISFEPQFPYVIQSWSERLVSTKGMTETKASRTHTIREAYWNKNHQGDRQLRKELGLHPDYN